MKTNIHFFLYIYENIFMELTIEDWNEFDYYMDEYYKAKELYKSIRKSKMSIIWGI